MGGKFTREGLYVYLWLIHVALLQKTTKFYKAIILQLKKKQRHYSANKGPSNQSYGFSVVMYGCESWTVKRAECRRIDAFELWY